MNDKHSLLQLKLRQSLDGSMSKQRILPLQVFLALDSLLSRRAFHTGSLPTVPLLPVSSFLERSKIRLSLVTHYLKESLFVGRKGRKKSRTDVCLVRNSCQDRRACVGERERQGKPHNQDLSCGLWPALLLQKQILHTEIPCTLLKA